MKKNDPITVKRTEILVKSFIEQEILQFNKASLGYVKKYFRYTHIGNRIIRKINAAKSGIFRLVSKDKDVEITIKKGESNCITFIEIKNNELCWGLNNKSC